MYSKNIGKYSHGAINKNGTFLLEFAKRNNTRQTNTFFKNKPSHLTTWESPQNIPSIIDSRTRIPRKNPYRNQIDYILVKIRKDSQVIDSVAKINFRRKSDHKPVTCKFKLKWP